MCCSRDFPGSSVDKEFACSAGNLGSIPGSGRFPWRRKWQPIPVLLPGKPGTKEPCYNEQCVCFQLCIS